MGLFVDTGGRPDRGGEDYSMSRSFVDALHSAPQTRSHGFILWLTGLSGAGKTTLAGALRARLSSRARIVTPGSRSYPLARRLLNRQFDFHPAVIVKCATDSDVAAAIRLARRRELSIAVRSGGTSPGGFSSNDGGLVIDLSPMRGLDIDPSATSIRVRGAVLLQELVRKLGATDHMVPVGECMPVGLPGLALGGGFGLLGRTLGLTCDNILGARVVTADGEVLTVSESEHPDLFWALRGAGGGNFGVVTQLTMRLHRIPRALAYAQVFWPMADAAGPMSSVASAGSKRS